MKKLLLLAAATLATTFAYSLIPAARGEGPEGSGRSTKPAVPTKIAVIDLNVVFKNYKKYEDLQEQVKEAAEKAQAKGKGMVQQVQAIQEELKEGTFKDGSPDFDDREKKGIQIATQIKTLEALTKKDLSQKSAKALLAVHQDMMQVVDQIAEQNGYTLVMQINREAIGTDDYRLVNQALSQPVIYRRTRDDISDQVVARLNKTYEAAGGKDSLSTAEPARKPAAATKKPKS